MRRLWPQPSAELDGEQLLAAYPRADRLLLRANMITSLDGAATLEGRSGALGSPADQDLMKRLRMQADVVLVGAGTIRVEGYGATLLDAEAQAWRTAHGLTPHPRFAVVTRSGDVPAKFFTDPPARPIVITYASAPHDYPGDAEVIDCGDSSVDPAVMVAELAARGLTQILCEGGPHLLGGLVAADLVDELCLTVSPTLAGPGSVRIVAGPPSPPPPHPHPRPHRRHPPLPPPHPPHHP
ncbi:pyrimidine reductase family protein [Catellatospora bangladeshensis]|uniref:pyrimidine reductase family protein n=1 Tax=Catellatospora bangladeshensis TaxID=310355 RepID=UPI00360AFFF4